MKYMNVDHLEEITIYEGLEYYASGCIVEVHIEDADGVVQIWNRFDIQDGLDKSVTFLELLMGRWYVDKQSLMFGDGSYSIEDFDEGEM